MKRRLLIAGLLVSASLVPMSPANADHLPCFEEEGGIHRWNCTINPTNPLCPIPQELCLG